MKPVLFDCRLICFDPDADALRALVGRVTDESPGSPAHFLIDADAITNDASLLARLGLQSVPPGNVHRLHAPAAGREDSSFAAWRDRVRGVIATAIAVEVNARTIVVPCPETDEVDALWPTDERPKGVALSAAQVADGEWQIVDLHAEGESTPPQGSEEPPLLAFVSPLPPEQSGIADYALELLPELSMHYRVELVSTVPSQVSRELAQWPVRDVEWFDRNADRYDRIVYQFGNSEFHRHMFALNERHPGLVVLHDAFLSGIARHMEKTGFRKGNFSERLYRDHGYRAVAERWRPSGALTAVLRYPCSRGVVAPALGVVVHSIEARSVVASHYGDALASSLSIVPHLRKAQGQPDRAAARAALGLSEGDFLVCSFGATSETKLNHRLLSAWQQSPLAMDGRCRLVFVGGNTDRYTARLRRSARGGNIAITGRCPAETYRLHLQAADLAVQLRCHSRGETSGAALDCLAAGLPLVINRHGSLAEIPTDIVAALDDSFSDLELASTMERLRQDGVERRRLSQAALAHVRNAHDPADVGLLYRDAIEASHRQPRAGFSLARRLAAALPPVAEPDLAKTVAACAQLSLPRRAAPSRLFFDVTAIARNDLRSGIERTVRNLLSALIENQPVGFRVEPVRLEDGQIILARDFACRLMGIRDFPLVDEPVPPLPGDLYLMADLAHRDVVAHRGLYRDLRAQGVRTAFMVHDLLPVTMPQFFPERAEADHAKWLDVVAEADMAVCVTRDVAADLAAWYEKKGHVATARIGFSHHGCELQASAELTAPSFFERWRMRKLGARQLFLAVGTVEPRKGHDDLIAAFDTLWADGHEIDLVVVGRAGFRDLEVIRRMRRHPRKGRRLFWYRSASDAMLDELYRQADCLVAPSRAEGFGLPLVEAGRHGLPVLARDIAVFREVAPPGTRFFPDNGAAALAGAVADWLRSPPARQVDPDMLTWERSASNLFNLIAHDGAECDQSDRHCGIVRP